MIRQIIKLFVLFAVCEASNRFATCEYRYTRLCHMDALFRVCFALLSAIKRTFFLVAPQKTGKPASISKRAIYFGWNRKRNLSNAYMSFFVFLCVCVRRIVRDLQFESFIKTCVIGVELELPKHTSDAKDKQRMKATEARNKCLNMHDKPQNWANGKATKKMNCEEKKKSWKPVSVSMCTTLLISG